MIRAQYSKLNEFISKSPNQLENVHALQSFHFCPEPLTTPLTITHVMKSSNLSFTDTVESRRILHERHGLPVDKPLLRVSCAETFLEMSVNSETGENSDDDVDSPMRAIKTVDGKLVNVHTAIKKSGVAGGKLFLVQGSYAYYHYLQDRMDDRGWGCAYRSLQTICSWLHMNHYITATVPSHRDIQAALVRIGDKPPSFLGSRDWIGSTEIGIYLDAEFDVTWKNIMLRSGSEMKARASELAAHFSEEGTPVMIGGANLAFTLLGIDWNAETGDVKFLILDPHYTGNDDLKTIVEKATLMEGYRATACGWRTPESFSKDSFYNLCLPLRPRVV